jgi:hypothetical protein
MNAHAQRKTFTILNCFILRDFRGLEAWGCCWGEDKWPGAGLYRQQQETATRGEGTVARGKIDTSLIPETWGLVRSDPLWQMLIGPAPRWRGYAAPLQASASANEISPTASSRKGQPATASGLEGP